MSRRLAAPLFVCAAIAGGTVAAGCGGDGEEMASGAATTTSNEQADAGAAESVDRVGIAEFNFAPEAVTVAAGTKLTWSNGDEAAHTATADDGSFDTGTLDKGQAGAVTLKRPGTYSYYCRFHPFMKGTVTVE